MRRYTLTFISWVAAALVLAAGTATAGPYTEAGIAGFVDGAVNPIFKGWATGYDYQPFDLAEIQNYMNGDFSHPEKALGPVTGNNFDIVSLGDMDQSEIDAWKADPANAPGPGEITLSFDNAIYNGSGYDFAVFENGFYSGGNLFAELGYVEVSSNGTDFARFGSVSLTPGPVGGYGTIDPTNVYNLAGKHPNAYGTSEGTGFDLDDLLDNALVLDGLVDLNNINYIKIVDIPGSGDFLDSQGNPIYDSWVTWGSGGVDLEAVGAINAVPIPGAAWLMASGFLGLAGMRRKQQHS